MLTHGELFAGVSGFGLGFERSGIKTLWRVEIDPTCQKVLRRHYPDDLLLSDVRECGARNLPPVDIITFSSPCQDMSVAGKRAGLGGERSGLFFEAARIVRELRPAIAVWENVPGALSSSNGRDFGAVLDELAESGALDIGWRVLDAQWFGVAQRRRRVFLVADFRAHRAAEILSVPEGGPWDLAPSREAGQGVAASLTSGSHGAGVNEPGRRKEDDVNLVAIAGGLTARYGKGPDSEATDALIFLDAYSTRGSSSPNQSPVKTDGLSDALDTTGPGAIAYQCQGTNVGEMGTLRSGNGHLTGGVPFTFVHNQDWSIHEDVAPALTDSHGGTPAVVTGGAQQDQFVETNGISPTLAHSSSAHGGHNEPKIILRAVAHALSAEGADASEDGTGRGTPLVLAHSENQRAEVPLTETSRQITTGGGKPGQGYPAAMVGMAVRRLTPLECERLMGLPDDWTAGNADSARYRMCGNGVVVNVTEWLGHRIAGVLR